ncbi:hypothetical protein ABPG74_006107 [Tetrahymena malaccensis]
MEFYQLAVFQYRKYKNINITQKVPIIAESTRLVKIACSYSFGNAFEETNASSIMHSISISHLSDTGAVQNPNCLTGLVSQGVTNSHRLPSSIIS